MSSGSLLRPAGRSTVRAVALLVALASRLAAGSTPLTASEAARACDRALAVSNRGVGALAEAEALLARARAACAETQGGALSCEDDFYSCRGYLRLEAALSADSGAGELLEGACLDLRTAYFEHRRSAATARNLSLAYEVGGALVLAARVLRDYAYSAPGDPVDFFETAGDLFLEAGQTREAQHVFELAELHGPSNESVLRRQLEAVTSSPPDLLLKSREYGRRGAWQVALEGAEILLQRYFSGRSTDRTSGSRPSPALYEEALVQWARAQAEVGNFSRASLARLGSTHLWPSRAVFELQRLAEDPMEGLLALDWWLGSPSARTAIARVLLDLELQLLVHDQPVAAREVLEAAFYRVAPDAASVDKATDEGAFLRLELARHLGDLLLDDRPALDPEGRAFDQLISRVEQDLERIGDGAAEIELRTDYHLTAANLLFGLDRLVPLPPEQVARTLAHLEAAFAAPTPAAPGSMAALLAEYWPGASRSGPSRLLRPGARVAMADLFERSGPQRLPESHAQLLLAAREFMELDVLKGAREALDRAASLGLAGAMAPLGPDAEAPDDLYDVVRLRELLKLRLDVRSAAIGELVERIEGALANAELSAWLQGQRFKLLVDLGQRAHEEGQDGLALAMNIRAIDAVGSLPRLGGDGDLQRLESAVHSVLSAEPVISVRTGLRGTPRSSMYYPKTLPVASSSPLTQRGVAIGVDIFLAARLRDFLSNEDPSGLPGTMTLSIDQGTLGIFPGTSTAEDARAAKELKRRLKAADIRTKPSTEMQPTELRTFSAIWSGSGLRTKHFTKINPPPCDELSIARPLGGD